MPVLCSKHKVNYPSGRVNHHWNRDKIYQVVRKRTLRQVPRSRWHPHCIYVLLQLSILRPSPAEGALLGEAVVFPGQRAHWHLNHQSHSSLLCLFSLSCSTNLQSSRQPFPPLCSHSHPQLPALLCQSLDPHPPPKQTLLKDPTPCQLP